MLNINGIDLFCGAGGLTHVLQRSGITINAGFDIDEFCQYAYTQNNHSKFIKADITHLKSSDVKKYLNTKQFTLIAGCAPCQPFSSYTNKIKRKDEKWGLINQFLRIVNDIKPDIVTMENVPNLAKQEIFRNFVKRLKDIGYFVSFSTVYCPDYGIPQSRHRLVLLASKLAPINLIKPTHNKENYITVRDAISQLPPIQAGEKNSKDILHISSKLSKLNMQRMLNSKPGGSWRDWPECLIAECHKKSSGNTYGSVYGRMEWDKPAPTITTQCYGFGNGRFGHPEQNRALTLREAAILQSFPNNYKFVKDGSNFSMRQIGTLIGNAVPVKLGEIIGKSIIKHIENIVS